MAEEDRILYEKQLEDTFEEIYRKRDRAPASILRKTSDSPLVRPRIVSPDKIKSRRHKSTTSVNISISRRKSSMGLYAL